MSDNPKQPGHKIIRRMLDDIEAVTTGRFYEDPEPIAAPVEMFLIRDGRLGGETFTKLSLREKIQVLDYYTDWSAYEAAGISFGQVDRDRQRELEIGDIRAYMKSQVAGLTLADLRAYGQTQRPQQQEQRQYKLREHGMER